MATGKHLTHFEGGNALSEFRARALLEKLRATATSIESVRARYLHVVWTDAPLSEADREQAERLLRYGEPFLPRPAELSLIVAPRLGTISPWASKATDIARNCGLPVHRVERVTEFQLMLHRGLLGGSKPLTADERAAVAALLHDRMTESVLDDRAAIGRLFDEKTAAPVVAVEIHDHGEGLARANREFGLALSDDELAYLHRAFNELAAPPPTSS